ncbi:hypothetical protein QTP88_021319 [Uroleucon formosanum]
MGKQSPIWNFFNKIGKSTSKCNKCQRDCEAKGGNTSNLSSHLRVRHPKLYLEFCHQKALNKKSYEDESSTEVDEVVQINNDFTEEHNKGDEDVLMENNDVSYIYSKSQTSEEGFSTPSSKTT